MSVNWGILANAPDPGAAFLAGMDKGREERAAAEKRKALAAYGMGQPGALNALMQADPELGIQLRGQEQKRAGDEREAFAGTTQQAAAMINQMKSRNPQMPDEQIYSTVRGTLIRMGAPGADRAPEQFDPQYYQGILSMADAGQKREPPSSVQEYEYAKQGGFQGSYMNFIDARRAQYITSGGNIFDTRSATQAQGGGAAAPEAVNEQTGEVVTWNGTAWVPKAGGAGSNAGGNFLDTLAPLP